MKHRILLFLLLLALPLSIVAQDTITVPTRKVEQKCSTCGKVLSKCAYKGKHPKTPKPTPKPTTGTLRITSSPSGAVVKIDGRYKGETPLTLEQQRPGTYSITFSAEGYISSTQSAIVTAGQTATCSATLKKKQATQPVTTTTTTTQPTTTTVSSQTFTANGVSFKMIRVEGGTFTMGATPDQGSDAGDYEKPTHQVTLSSYSIGETEVTQALWEAVMGSNPSDFKGSNRPVENVSWEDCQTFLSRLNYLTSRTFRLPTEAEWEYAARGGNKSRGYRYSGSNTLGDVAWYEGNSGSQTHNVKTKAANELGLYDMSGNVWEWCQDWYGSYGSSSQTNPRGASSGSDRVYRGGGWNNMAWSCRVSNRSHWTHGRDNDLGLRLAL